MMTGMTLVEFLRARLDEDERLARDVESSVGAERASDPYSDGSGTADRDAFPSYPWGAEEGELEFMAGPGHPSRVLAEVAMKRRILAEHRDDRTSCSTCGTAGEYDVPWPCTTVELLALPYADHPDYRQEWAP